MLFLTSYTLSHPECHKLHVTDSYSIHRVVYDLFPVIDGVKKRILFADKGFRKGRRQILILSHELPASDRVGDVTSKVIPERFLDFAAYKFEIEINPVRRMKSTKRLVPLRSREEIKNWFESRSPEWGFRSHNLDVSEHGADIFRAKDRRITLARAQIAGGLEVVDHALFRKHFSEGIGRGKAFGCGLLQLRPI